MFSGGAAGSSFGLRKVYFPLVLVSTQAKEHDRSVTRNTSVCTFDLQDSPINIPTYAQNVYAQVVQATVPVRANNEPDEADTGVSIAECSFVRGGRGVDGKINRAILMRDGDEVNNVAEMGLTSNEASFDVRGLKVPCEDQLKGKGISDVEIRWVNEFGELRRWIDPANGDDYIHDSRHFKWSLTIMIEWEEPIDLSRLMDPGTEAKFR